MRRNKELDKLISIIVPVYNVSNYITKCLDTIINQTYKNIEIILVDDGSTDNSYNICNEYAEKDHRIKLYTKKNTGVSDTRNFGIDKSKGDYIMFIDSDDWIDIDMCEYLIGLILEHDCKIAACKYYINDKVICDNTGSIKILKEEEIITDYFTNSNIMTCIWNKLYKKDIIVQNKFVPYNNNGEDIIFTCKVLNKCNKLVYSDSSKYHYNVSNTSITRSVLSMKKVLDNIENHKNQILYIEEKYPDNNYLKAKSVEKMLNALIELYNQIDLKTKKDIKNIILSNINETYTKISNSDYIDNRILKKVRDIVKHPIIYDIKFKLGGKIKKAFRVKILKKCT